MKVRVLACAIVWLLFSHSVAYAYIPASQAAPCDEFVPGDLDADGDIDQNDFDFFQSCQTRAEVPNSDPLCKRCDFDGDGDVDMDDFGIWQRLYSGPQNCGPNLKEPPETPVVSPLRDEFPPKPVNPVHSVHLFSGEFYQQVEDLRIKGRGLDFIWTRKYRSRIGLNTDMGKGWDFSYNIRIERIGPSIRLYDGNNRTDVYNSLTNNGIYIRIDMARILVKNPDGSFTLTFADTSAWEFNALDAAAAAGKINRVQDRNGNALTFSYDAQGRLVTVHDTLNRDISIAYNTDGYIASVTDFTGRQVTYDYYHNSDTGGSDGDLKSATTPAVVGTPNGNDFSSGKTTLYTYSTGNVDARLNHNLLTITDGKGQTYLINLYAADLDANQDLQFDRLVQQLWGGPGDRIDVVYKKQTPNSANNNAVTKATVNDRVGNVSEYLYDGLNRLVIHRQYTGRADPDQPTDLDAGLNPPVSPLRSTDPSVFTTVTTYNDPGIESNYSYPRRIDYPNGNAVEYTYELGLNPTAPQRTTRNLRQIRYLPGPLGGDQSQIVEQFEYDSNTNMLTRHVDGRGNETVHSYDTHGNRVHTQHAVSSAIEDWEYNSYGQMTAHTSPDNGSNHRRRDEYTYYSGGPQTGYLHQEIVDAPGLALTRTYEYDSLGRMVRHIDPRGNDTLFTLNALDQVVRRTSREVTTSGGSVRYDRDIFYDANNNIIRVERQNPLAAKHIANYTYDELNYTTSIMVEQGLIQITVLDYSYDANRNRTLTRYGEAINGTQPADTLTVEYDERNLIFRQIRGQSAPEQSTTQYDYDSNGNLARKETGMESAGHVTMYTYDGYNRGVLTTDPMGNVRTRNYDANGNLNADRLDGQESDVLGSTGNVRLREVDYQYDAMNRRIVQDDQFFNIQTQANIGDGAATTHFGYTDNSQLKIVTPDNDANWQFDYDTANRHSIMTDPKGNSSTYAYDANGNIVSVTEVDKSDMGSPDHTLITAYLYDNLDRRISRTDNANNVTTYEYDALDNLVQEIDPRGNKIQYAYDILNQPMQTDRILTDTGTGSGTVIATISTIESYDTSGRRKSFTDYNGHTTMCTYDPLDRPNVLSYADNTARTMIYDAHDNVVGLTDPNGTVVSYNYDALNRLITNTVTAGPGVVGTTSETYTYDGAGRVVTANDNDSAVTRLYDSLSHITRETQQVVPAGPTAIVTAVHDALGNRTRVTYPGGRDLIRSYDSVNRVIQISDNPPGPLTNIASYQYLGPYLLERTDLGNGTRLQVSYDDIRRIVNTHHNVIATSALIDDRTYVYDPSDNKVQVQAPAGPPQDIRLYQYDSINRLIGSQNPPAATNIQYNLDGVGNRTNVIGGPDAGIYTLDPAQPDPADAQVNQYTSVIPIPNPAQGRTYDHNGNLKTSHNGQRLYSYDYRNQLVEFTDLGAGLTILYRYDCFGRRIEQNAGGVITRFYHEGMNNIEEQNQSNITLATYVFGFGLPCEGTNDGDPVVMTRSGQKYFYHTDDLGSIVKVTNATGQIVEKYQYTDFGKPSFFNGIGNPIAGSSIGNPYLFAGNRYDTGTGLMFASQRPGGWGDWDIWMAERSMYIDPTIGARITRGALNSLGNGLSYHGNNPASSMVRADYCGDGQTHAMVRADYCGDGQARFRPRDYCVQYRESDYSFVSRLMEEEGIYYFFNHKTDNGKLEMYDYPGGYAQRFDGVDRGGSPRSTPKPVVGASQTAVVVGPSGDEIYTDKYGRIKVQFHWDREGKKDSESCWVRAVQPNSLGATQGFIPKKDDEPPNDATNVTADGGGLVSGSTTSKSSGGCGATGFEAVPVMLLWYGAFKRRSQKKNPAL